MMNEPEYYSISSGQVFNIIREKALTHLKKILLSSFTISFVKIYFVLTTCGFEYNIHCRVKYVLFLQL